MSPARQSSFIRGNNLALICRASWAMAILLALNGCGRPAHPAGEESRTQASAADMPLRDFAAKRGLRISSISSTGDRVVLEKPGLRLLLAADLPYANVNGRLCQLSRPVFRVNGDLWIPGEIAEHLGDMATAGALPTPVRGVVIIDPGHGGHDAGAVANGLREKDITLDVAQRAAAKLRAQGARVILTRTSDRYVSLEQRSEIANREPGAIFVSIHVNAAGSANRGAARGVETFVLTSRIPESYRVQRAAAKYNIARANGAKSSEISTIANMSRLARDESYKLAIAIQRHLVSALGESDRKVQGKNLAVLRENYFGPAVLTEIGFLTNTHTARRLANPSYCDRISEAIADGILEYMRRR